MGLAKSLDRGADLRSMIMIPQWVCGGFSPHLFICHCCVCDRRQVLWLRTPKRISERRVNGGVYEQVKSVRTCDYGVDELSTLAQSDSILYKIVRCGRTHAETANRLRAEIQYLRSSEETLPNNSAAHCTG